MARKRMIDPGIWGDETFSGLSVGARLLYIGMISMADDDGRLSGSVRELRNRIFPGDDALRSYDIETFRCEVHNANLAKVYNADGKTYIQLAGFKKHQSVRWYVASKIPAPPIGSVDTHHEKLKCADAVLPQVCGSPIPTLSSPTVVVVEGGLGETAVAPQADPVPPTPAAKPKPVRAPEVDKLFAVYLEATGRRSGALTDKAAARLSEMLAWAGSLEAAERGVRKVGASAHHRGNNEQRKRYDGLDDKPFRTAEAFRGWCEEPIDARSAAGPPPETRLAAMARAAVDALPDSLFSETKGGRP